MKIDYTPSAESPSWNYGSIMAIPFAAKAVSKGRDFVGFINNDPCEFEVVHAKSPTAALRKVKAKHPNAHTIQMQPANWLLQRKDGYWLGQDGRWVVDLDQVAIFDALPVHLSTGQRGKWILDNVPSIPPLACTHHISESLTAFHEGDVGEVEEAV